VSFVAATVSQRRESCQTRLFGTYRKGESSVRATVAPTDLTGVAVVGDTSALDLAKVAVQGVLPLAGVGLGYLFARSAEDRSWRRNQIVDASSAFLRAAAAVEQWGTSEQFAQRLAKGQYPTDYKEDLERLDAAVAVLAVGTPDALRSVAVNGAALLRNYVTASAAHQRSKPKQSMGMSFGTDDTAERARDLATWQAAGSSVAAVAAVAAALAGWRAAREAFVTSARAALKAHHSPRRAGRAR
jgi:hypothetical protein